MKKELIDELFEKFEHACYIYNEVECWSARELQIILGYTKWDNFLKVIEKAKTACDSNGVEVSNHFAGVGKMVPIGSGTERKIEDIALSRYACYLVAQNGDPGKMFLAIVDVIAVLTNSPNPQVYWRVLKKRLKDEGNETVTNCHGLKMLAPNGKMRLTDVVDTEQIFRLIQPIFRQSRFGCRFLQHN